MRSLRARVLIGSLLWTLGLLAITHMVSLFLFRRHTYILTIDHRVILVFGLLLLALGLFQVRGGLSPIERLRAKLLAVRDGNGRKIEGKYPSEVQPLVNDLNTLLEDRELQVKKAVAKAGDLAHGLKTPLAVLAQEAERADAAGQHEIASMIQGQVERMRRTVEYHLVHARAASSGNLPGVRCSVRGPAEGIARTLLHIYAGRATKIEVVIPLEHQVRCQREDLEEMLGNLLDNACKWAKSAVRVQSSEVAGNIVIAVEDDGPGIQPSMRDVVLQRGVRADEASPGSGLGLAIVRDLVELYGGTIALETSALGGLRALLRLPAA